MGFMFKGGDGFVRRHTLAPAAQSLQSVAPGGHDTRHPEPKFGTENVVVRNKEGVRGYEYYCAD